MLNEMFKKYIMDELKSYDVINADPIVDKNGDLVKLIVEFVPKEGETKDEK